MLLDAGAGTKWSYKSKESGKVYSRSEGLAVASLEMFKSGLFSSDPTEPCQVDGAGLKKVTVEKLAKGMQHSEQNPLAGIEGRAGLLVRLSEALNHQDFFGVDARPGNMLGTRNLPVFYSNSVLIIMTNRLLARPPLNTCFLRTYRPYHYALVGSNGRLLLHLATLSDTDRRCGYWRCLAVLTPPAIPTRSSMGEHHSIPQADAMALLFDHGTHVKIDGNPLCRQRSLDRSARVP